MTKQSRIYGARLPRLRAETYVCISLYRTALPRAGTLSRQGGVARNDDAKAFDVFV